MAGQLSKDQIFIQKIADLVLANLTNINFGPAELASLSGVSYITLHRRLKSIRHVSVTSFIREIRLQKALEMIRNNEGTLSEIAYKTGFSSPNYFNKCFHEHYGFPPGKVKKEDLNNLNKITPAQGTATLKKAGFGSRYLIPGISILVILTLLYSIGYRILYKNSIYNSGLSGKYPEKSIAVLPFANFSPESENEYFCNGITDEILNQLFRIKELKVKARTSVEKYRNSNLDTKVIGKELDVSLIMEGSVRKSGEDLRITAQLIDARTGNHLWSETYDGKYTTAVFEFQSNVAKKVAESLNAVVTPQEEKMIDLIPTQNIKAHDLYMKSLDMFNIAYEGGGSDYYRLALNLANQALDADPELVGALKIKSRCYFFLGNHDSSFYYARKTLELDRDDPRALNEMAYYYFYIGASDSALKYWKKTLEYSNLEEKLWSYLGIGQVLFFQKNRIFESLPYYQKALESGGDTTWLINSNIAMLFYAIGDYEKAYLYDIKTLFLSSACLFVPRPFNNLIALKKYEKAGHFLDSVRNVTPCAQVCDMMRLRLYTALKEYDSALIYLAGMDKRNINNQDLYYNYLLLKTGRKDEAVTNVKSVLDHQEKISSTGELPWFSQHYEIVAAVYALLGDKKRCLESLSELEKRGCSNMPFGYNVFPGFDYLRDDPEFMAICKRLDDNKAAIREKIRKLERRGEVSL